MQMNTTCVRTGKNSDEAPSSNDKSEFNDYVLIISSGIIFLGIMIIIFGLAVTKIFTEEVGYPYSIDLI